MSHDFFSLPQNIPHEGVFRDGQIVEIYQNKMVSERSEFHFVISTISPSAPEPGRFWLLLLFLYLLSHGRRKEMSVCLLVLFEKNSSSVLKKKTFGSFTKEQKKEMKKKGAF